MWLMSDIEALVFIATVALMVMLARIVASTRQVVRQRVTSLGLRFMESATASRANRLHGQAG